MIMLGLKYYITNEILNKLVEITKAVEDLPRRRAPPVAFRQIRKDSLAKNAHSSTKIEGNPLTLNQVKSLVDGRKVMAGRKAINEVENYIRVLENIESYQESGEVALDGILRMHYDTTKEVIDNPLASGKLRDVQNYVVSGSKIIYTPPPPEKVGPMMEELVSWINSDARDLHPVIQAGICHYAMAMVHPFEDGNGRAARGLAVLTLRIRGFDEKGLFAIDEYYEGDMPAYYGALGEVDESKRDLTNWLEYYTEGILYSVTVVLDIIKSLEHATGLNPRQRKALKHAVKHGYITNREYRKINSVSNKAAYLDLKDMVEKEILVEEGRGRAKKYVIPVR
jgi:Fic family protein